MFFREKKYQVKSRGRKESHGLDKRQGKTADA